MDRSTLLLAVGLLSAVPAVAHAQDADLDGRTGDHAAALVSAISEMASRDVAGAICADSRHRRAVVLSSALEGRERRLRAAVSRHDAASEREERAVIRGLLEAIRALHAEAASCVGEAVVEPARPDEEPRFSCVLEIDPVRPIDPMAPARSEAPTSAVRE